MAVESKQNKVLFGAMGTCLGALATLLVYQGIAHPDAETLDEGDAIAASLGAAVVGLLPEVLRYCGSDAHKPIDQALQRLRTSGLKVGTLLTLMSVLSSEWNGYSWVARAGFALPTTIIDALLSHKCDGKFSKTRWRVIANTLSAGFSTFYLF